MNHKECGRKWLWSNLRFYLGISLEVQTQIAKTARFGPSLNSGRNAQEGGLRIGWKRSVNTGAECQLSFPTVRCIITANTKDKRNYHNIYSNGMKDACHRPDTLLTDIRILKFTFLVELSWKFRVECGRLSISDREKTSTSVEEKKADRNLRGEASSCVGLCHLHATSRHYKTDERHSAAINLQGGALRRSQEELVLLLRDETASTRREHGGFKLRSASLHLRGVTPTSN